MLRATTPCTFSTSQLPKLLQTPQFLTHVTSQMCFAPQRRALFNISTSKSGPILRCFVHFDFEMCFAATTVCTFSTSQLPKLLQTPQFLTHFTSKCASRHNAVHFFNISTSKTAPNPSVFNTFYFQMCFAPQRRALFQHLNFQKWSDPEVFCTF